MLGLDETEDETKFEKWLRKKFGDKLMNVIMGIGMVLGVLLSVGLFVLLPNYAVFGVNALCKHFFDFELPSIAQNAISGVLRIAIFVTYILLVSLMKDIRRTFEYHGAEHKSIACFEAGGELTPERAKEFTRFHPRCGTSFMFLTILIGIFAGFFIKTMIPGLPLLAYTCIRLGILPILMGLGYEVIRLAGKHDNIATRIMSAPGLWAQRLTTKEPTEDMLEVAIISLKCALRDDYPEFREFYEQKPWEPEVIEENTEEAEAEASEADAVADEDTLPCADEEENDAQ